MFGILLYSVIKLQSVERNLEIKATRKRNMSSLDDIFSERVCVTLFIFSLFDRHLNYECKMCYFDDFFVNNAHICVLYLDVLGALEMWFQVIKF